MTEQLDPRFSLPRVAGFEYAPADYVSDYTEPEGTADLLVVDGVTEDVPTSVPTATGALIPPDYVVVLSQTTRVTSGGTVVDVIIEVADPPGATSYNVKLTKT